MRSVVRLALLAAVAVSAAGCRFKGYEGFVNATTPRPDLYAYPKHDDPYGDGGVADATGGLDPRTPYGKGARQDATVVPAYDQAQKGSGQMEGEYPNVARGGHAQTNAPSFQPSPSDVGVGR